MLSNSSSQISRTCSLRPSGTFRSRGLRGKERMMWNCDDSSESTPVAVLAEDDSSELVLFECAESSMWEEMILKVSFMPKRTSRRYLFIRHWSIPLHSRQRVSQNAVVQVDSHGHCSAFPSAASPSSASTSSLRRCAWSSISFSYRVVIVDASVLIRFCTETAFLESCMYRATEKPRQNWRHCVAVNGLLAERAVRWARIAVRHWRRRAGSMGAGCQWEVDQASVGLIMVGRVKRRSWFMT